MEGGEDVNVSYCACLQHSLTFFQRHVAQLVGQIERENVRLELKVMGELTFHHTVGGAEIARYSSWSCSQHVAMMECVRSAQTQVELGEMVPQDLQRAKHYYTMADLEGDAEATFHLALLDNFGLGMPVDVEKTRW